MHIEHLSPLVAQRIAAGEVIERPASVVRELVDNALDSHAKSIKASIVEGGLDEIIVIDDGTGIEREDLTLCCESHATSKVHTLDDLYHLDTMGFRGEALYSISAVSRVTIASSFQGQDPYSVVVDNGKREQILPGGPDKGTRVSVKDLFIQVPARRLFLKRPSSEASMCQQVFSEKAFAYPSIHFQFYCDNALKLDLPETDRKGRVLDLLAEDRVVIASEMKELSAQYERFSLYAVASSPALHRGDRSRIKIFVNNRPVEDFALVQAVTYGYGEQLPGGFFPYCYLFLTVDSTLVDFNIHPTKREVKLRNKAEIHHAVVTMISSQLKRTIPRLVAQTTEVQPNLESPRENIVYHRSENTSSVGESIADKPIDPQWFIKAREVLQNTSAGLASDHTEEKQDIWGEQQKEEEFTYIGQAFNLFLIAQKGDDLYLVDQHAAHERILFDEIRKKQDVQPLLVPMDFETERDVDVYLKENLDVYLNLGIKLVKTGELTWQLVSIPALFKNIEKQLVLFLQKQTGDSSEVEKGLYAIISCHSAIRSGDPVDRNTATALLRKVFALKDPVCPHGRTFVIRLNKQELAETVGRT